MNLKSKFGKSNEITKYMHDAVLANMLRSETILRENETQ